MYKQSGLYVRKTLINNIVYNIYFSNLSKSWLIILPGIPQYIFKQSYIRDLIKNYSVLVPYYSGSFHSNGRFDVSSLKKTLHESINLIKNGEFYEYFEKKKYVCNTKISWVFGFSFGAIVLYDYLSSSKEGTLPTTEKLMISPMFNISNKKLLTYWDQKLDFLSSNVYKNVYRGLKKKEIITWFKNLEKKTSLSSSGILLYGEEDKYINNLFYKEKLPNYKEVIAKGYSHEIDKLVEYFIKLNFK